MTHFRDQGTSESNNNVESHQNASSVKSPWKVLRLRRQLSRLRGGEASLGKETTCIRKSNAFPIWRLHCMQYRSLPLIVSLKMQPSSMHCSLQSHFLDITKTLIVQNKANNIPTLIPRSRPCPTYHLLSRAESISSGLAFSVFNHSPLNAFMSQLFSSACC